MISSNRISLALAALVLVVLAGASSAFAQSTPQFNVSTAVPFVANTGRSEVLGQVVLNADGTCLGAAFCVSTAGTIQVLYVGTTIDNVYATAGIGGLDTNGIEVCEIIAGGLPVCNVAGVYLSGPAAPSTGFTLSNTTAGGVVAFGVKGLVNFEPGDQIIVRGVRGQIDLGPGSVAGSSILAQLTTSPATIASFSPVQQEVARSADPLVVGKTSITILQCQPKGTAKIKLTEGFNTAWVDHGNDGTDTGGGHPDLTRRPLFGGTNNSRVTILLTGRPTGVTVAWPASSDLLATGGVLILNAGSTNDTATYTFHTPSTALSDVTAEAFTISLIVSTVIPGVTTTPAGASILLGGTGADFGAALVQAQMAPPPAFSVVGTTAPSSVGPKPRYNHPLENVPADTLFTVASCATNLLYPWVLNFAGLDTGIAISNTSLDPYGTTPQAGTCAVNLYPTDKTTNNGVNAGGAVTVTTQSVAGGSVWRSTLSGQTAWAGLAGYIIARCNFQYGHGFAFITDNFGVGSPGAAQGYLALVIPDPLLLGGSSNLCGVALNPSKNYRSAGIAADDIIGSDLKCLPYGEGLTQ
jgi:hypothetical protein